MDKEQAQETLHRVTTSRPVLQATPFGRTVRDYVYGTLWSRAGLSWRDRRWITIACTANTYSPAAVDSHIYAALKSGDIELEAMLEFVLHFAVYCGFPRATQLESSVARQWARVQEERGAAEDQWVLPTDDTVEPMDWDACLELGTREFAAVNLGSTAEFDTPYWEGVYGFAFGHVWSRPGLSRRERRIITICLAAVAGANDLMESHVTSALGSKDVTESEIRELALHYTAYYGFASGSTLNHVIEAVSARI